MNRHCVAGVALQVPIRITHVVGRAIEKRVSLLCVITLVPAFAEFLPFVGVEADMFVCNRSSHLIKIQISEPSFATFRSTGVLHISHAADMRGLRMRRCSWAHGHYIHFEDTMSIDATQAVMGAGAT